MKTGKKQILLNLIRNCHLQNSHKQALLCFQLGNDMCEELFVMLLLSQI